MLTSIATLANALAATLGRAPPRRTVGLIIVVALVLASPSLGVGLVADDLLHTLELRESSGLAGVFHRPLDLFRFATGEPESARLLIEVGVFPWWVDPHAVLAFFRPLSSLTHWFDHAVWPEHPVLMHLQSMLWFAALLAVIATLYLRIMARATTALLAFFFYAVDDAHGAVVAWIANRNMIVALLIAAPALLTHDAWRRGGARHRRWLGPCFFALGLCAGEAATVVLAYLVAYALFLDVGAKRARVASLLPYLVIVVAWRAIYDHLGYGASGSGIYVDPGRHPFDFVAATATRLPILLLAQFAFPWADLWEIYPLVLPHAQFIVMLAAVLGLIALAALLVPLLRRERSARFWAAGCVLAAIPTCATFPHDRLLLGAGIGAMPLVAELVFATFFAASGSIGCAPLQRSAADAGRRPLTIALALVHGLLAPALLPYRAHAVGAPNRLFQAADDTIASTRDIEDKTVIMLNPPIDPFAAYFSIAREAAHRHRPRRLLWLATGVSAVTVRTVDAHTVLVRPLAGYLSSSTQLMLRDLRSPVGKGTVVRLDGATIEVIDVTPDGRPAEISVRFAKQLDDPSFVWVQWGTHGYVPFTPPARGERVDIGAVDMRQALMVGG